ncbi:MAG: carboxylate--amine ligase, partial [Acidobacteriia bacterium]|nr:carboxylate--amine ligase [Terriglobia bacterium]
GQHLQPLPEGSSYLGFIVARATRPENVEQALRTAHARLHFQIAAALPAFRPET